MNIKKAVILAGGLGSRLSEETVSKPKPMVELNFKPILWHIMKIFSNQGINNFIICSGYKSHIIKEYFNNYFLNNTNVKIDLKKNKTEFLNKPKENWEITIVNTGLNSNTGGRLKRIKKFILKNENFYMTYGDGLANVNLKRLYLNHIKSKKIATVTAVKSKARFGNIVLKKNLALKFEEKNVSKDNWINGGFFVLNNKVFDFIKNDQTIFEKDSLKKITLKKQLNVYKHTGFWQPMDTLKEKNFLENLITKNNIPPWLRV